MVSINDKHSHKIRRNATLSHNYHDFQGKYWQKILPMYK